MPAGHPGSTVALVVSDMSRFWMRQDLVVPHLVDYLTQRCGVREDDITIVIANGTHTGGDEAELRTLVTDAVYDRITVENHNCDSDDLVYLGTTPHGTPVSINRTAALADMVISCFGAATHHVMAGFGGGRKKASCPASAAGRPSFTTTPFPWMPQPCAPTPAVGNGILQGNPLHEDMCEAAGLVKNLFMVNLVMNTQMRLAAIFSGHYLTSWEQACRTVNRIYQVDVPRKADVVITSCGGFPKDISLYQGTKAIDNVESALKPGGTLILVIEAGRAGLPNTSAGRRISLPAPLSSACVSISRWPAMFSSSTASRHSAIISCSIPALIPRRWSPMGIRAFSDVEALLEAARLPGKTVYVIPNGATVIPHIVKEASANEA